VAKLDATKRADLPDRAFAYIDSSGKRRLPINDEAHVRNALARFNRVKFENEAARERARKRLLTAAKKYGIVPVGFITGQLQTERVRGEQRMHVELPAGVVTMLMTDIEGSTDLVHRLGDDYRHLINEVRVMLVGCASGACGTVVENRADDFFAVFEQPHTAIDAAVAIQRELCTRSWADGHEVRVRVGIHTGKPTINKANYIGMAVHTTARISAAAHGGQIIVSGATRDAARGSLDGIRFRSLGEHTLRGIPNSVALYQVAAKGLATRFPDVRTAGRARAT
jgi:class 3 adenylate cyclase